MSAFLLAVLAAGASWADPPKAEKKKEEAVFCAKFFGETGCSGKPSQESEQYSEEWARGQAEAGKPAPGKPAPSAPAAPAAASPQAGTPVEQPAAAGGEPGEPLRDAVADRNLAGAESSRSGVRRSAGGQSPEPVAEAKREASRSRKEPETAARGLSAVGRTAAAFAPGEGLRDSPSHAATLGAGRPGAAGSGLMPPPRGGRPVSTDKLDRVFDAADARPEAEPSPDRPAATPKEERPSAPASATPSVDCAGAAPAEGTCGSRVPAGSPGLVSETAKPAQPSPVFVALELDISATPGQYRDAVAGLTRDAGFSLDARFAPVYRGADRDRVSLWGWLPQEKVREVVTLKGVERIEAAPQAQPTPARAAAESDWKLVLRLPPQEPAETAMAAALLRLNDLGFSWKRTESRDASGLITVVGTMPTGSVRRALSDAAVVRLEPARSAPAPAAPAPLKASAGPAEELGRLLRRHPVLLLLAALFPLIGSLVRSSR